MFESYSAQMSALKIRVYGENVEKTKCRFIIFLAMLVVLTCVFGIVFWPFIRDLQNPEYRERFSAWVAVLGAKGALLLFALQILQIVAAVIPGGPMELIAGAAYGIWGALAILEAGNIAATLLIFFAVRKFGAPFIVRFFGKSTIDSWGFLKDEKKIAQITFVVFLIPGIPKDTLTYLAPLTKLSPLQFVLISVIARFPAMFSTAAMGNAVMKDKWGFFIFLFVLTAAAGILGIQFRDRIIRRFRARRDSR